MAHGSPRVRPTLAFFEANAHAHQVVRLRGPVLSQADRAVLAYYISVLTPMRRGSSEYTMRPVWVQILTRTNLTIDGGGVNKDVEGGKTVNAKATLKAGTYAFHCEYHPAQMKGTIVVT